ncbi:MAG TPA: APC family permease [Steroidobacteraceae bacterium]|jgi:amino acid transporter|nr:APC family permease [Steroidobacteraceae bacterium]
MSSPSSATPAPVLKRALGVRDVALFMVTAGCSVQWATTAAAAGPSSLLVWVVGGLTMFLPLSVCVVFLSSRYPQEGGLYVWSGHAFGPFAAFMTGWTYWTANLPFLTGLLYFAAGTALYVPGERAAAASGSPAYFVGFALAALGIAVALNVHGLASAKWLNSAGALARWLETILLVALGVVIWRRFGTATLITRHTLVPGLRFADFMFWATVAFAWTGPEAASFMGGEIRDPRRTVPRALAIAAPMIAAIYILCTASVLVSISPEDTSALYGLMDAISHDAARLGVQWLIPLAAVFVVLDRLGSVGVWLGAVARLPFVAGLDQHLPRSFARLHPRHGSPTVAIWTQAAVIAAFVCLGQAGTSVRGAYTVVVDMMVVATMLPFLALFASAIRLARRAPAPGEVRIRGGGRTVVAFALLGLLTTVTAMALAFVPAPDEPHPLLAVLKVVGMTLTLLLAGAAVYFAGGARARRQALREAG